jgi:hypothetical protein
MLPKLEMITDISRGIYYIGGPEYHPKRKKLKGYQKNRK